MNNVINLEDYQKRKEVLKQINLEDNLTIEDEKNIISSLIHLVLTQSQLLEISNRNISLLHEKNKELEIQFVAVSAQALSVVETLIEKKICDRRHLQGKYESILEDHLILNSDQQKQP